MSSPGRLLLPLRRKSCHRTRNSRCCAKCRPQDQLRPVRHREIRSARVHRRRPSAVHSGAADFSVPDGTELVLGSAFGATSRVPRPMARLPPEWEQESAWAAHPMALPPAWEQESVWTSGATSQTAHPIVRLPASGRESAWALYPMARLAGSEQEPVLPLEQASAWAAYPVARLPASERESIRALEQAWSAYLLARLPASRQELVRALSFRLA